MNKITGTFAVNSSPANDGGYKATEKANQAVVESKPVNIEKDDLVLTETARLLADAKKIQQAYPDVDAQKVAQVKMALQEKGYEISAERVARKMIAMERL